MPSTTIDNAEHFTLDGPPGLPVAIALVVGLLLLFSWSLLRERRILGPKQTLLFWGLRCVALSTVIWMLLSPTNVRVETSTTRQVVAVVTDVSGSMTTVDGPGTADDFRWAVAQSEEGEYAAIRAADRAVVAAGIAQRHLQAASEAILQHQRESLVAEETHAARTAVERLLANVDIVAKSISAADTTFRNAEANVNRIRKSVNGPEFKAFYNLADALRKGRPPSQKGWRESLPDIELRLAGIRRQLQELARDVATGQSVMAQRSSRQMLTSVQQQNRLGRAAGVVNRLHEDVLASLREDVEIRQSSFDKTLTRLSNQDNPASEITALHRETDPDSDPAAAVPASTDLSSVLEQLNRDRVEQPLAAAFILTDVAHNRVSAVNPRDAATDLRDVPVYVVPIGNTQHVRDVRIQSVFVPNVAMRNDDVVVEVTLQAHDCDGESCLVQLLQDGSEIDQRLVNLDSGFATRKVRFERKMSELGTQHFQVAIAPLEGELTEMNNFDDFEVNVTRSDIKLLLADELPRWEFRYLAQLFRRDRKVECDELLFQPRLIATGRRQESGTFPATVDDWDQYDVVMLGDLPPEHLGAASQESMIRWLRERGGTLVMIAGANAMPQSYVDHPLESIVPVSLIDNSPQIGSDTGYAFHLTAEGKDHDALMIGETDSATRIAWEFINQVSPVYELSSWRQPRAATHTLISAVPRGTLDVDFAAKQNALLCWQPVGRGMVLYLSAPDTWRLRLLRGDRLHYRFWGQLLRWATATDLSAGSEVVRIRPDKSRYTSEEAIRVVVRLSDGDGNPVVSNSLQAVAAQDGNEHTAPLTPDGQIPGQYVGEFRNLPAGVYSLTTVGEDVTRLLEENHQEGTPTGFTVQADLPVELLDTRCDRALAQQIADITGGQVLPPTAIDEVLRLTNLEPQVTEKIETRPLWIEWKYLWIVFGCLQSEWIIRKWKGLS